MTDHDPASPTQAGEAERALFGQCPICGEDHYSPAWHSRDELQRATDRVLPFWATQTQVTAAHPSLDREARVEAIAKAHWNQIGTRDRWDELPVEDRESLLMQMERALDAATPLDRETGIPVLDDAALLAAENAVGEAEGAGLLSIEEATRIAVETYIARCPDLMAALDAPFTTSDGSDDPIRASAK